MKFTDREIQIYLRVWMDSHALVKKTPRDHAHAILKEVRKMEMMWSNGHKAERNGLRNAIAFTILFALFMGMMIALLPNAIDGEIEFRERLNAQHVIQAGGM